MSGYTTFTVGQVLTAQDVNGYLMAQSVPRVADATALAAIPTPEQGQLAYRKDTGLLYMYSAAYSSTTNRMGADAAGWIPVAPHIKRHLLQKYGATAIANGATLTTGGTLTVKRRPYKQRLIVSLVGNIAASGSTAGKVVVTPGTGGTVVTGQEFGNAIVLGNSGVAYADMGVIEIASGAGADVTITLTASVGAGTLTPSGFLHAETLVEGEW